MAETDLGAVVDCHEVSGEEFTFITRLVGHRQYESVRSADLDVLTAPMDFGEIAPNDHCCCPGAPGSGVERYRFDGDLVRAAAEELGDRGARGGHLRRHAVEPRECRVGGHAVGNEEEILSRKPSADEPFAALAFKIAAHPFFGKLTFVRVYSGHITAGTGVLNATKGKKERIGKLFQMHANKEMPVEDATAGHIYAMIGLKDTTTGDTLCDSNAPIVLESMSFPDPVINVSIEPKTKSDQEKLGVAIQKLAEEDPTFSVELDEQTDGSRSRLFRGGTGDKVTQQSPPRLRRVPNVLRQRTEESCTHHPQRQGNGVLAVDTDRTVAFSDVDHVSAGALTELDLE